MKLIFLTLASMIFMSSCNDSLDGSSVTTGSMEVSILKPYIDGTTIGKSSVVAGDCGIANYPIQISGDVSVYTVCQSDNTWSAAISSDGVSVGQTLNISVALKSPDYSSSSPLVNRSFVKADLACDEISNHSKVFANSEVANGDSIPYVICTPAQLSNINLYPDKKFVIGKSIDFGYSNFTPIAKPFTGELNGQEFTLKNININSPGSSSVGLFKVASNATIMNLKIADANVVGNIRAGIIAGDWRGAGTIQNVDVTGTVSAVQMAGGLIGLGNTSSQLSISYVNVDVDVSANDFAGGLIAYVYSDGKAMSISNSNVFANVDGKKYVGGIVGRLWMSDATFTNVKHKGDITSNDQFVGGLVGEAYHGMNIVNSKHIGSITVTRNSTNQDMNVGGLIGVTRGVTSISDSSVVSNITMGGDYAGGLVGRFFGGSITNSHSRGNLVAVDDYYNSVNKFVGGITGNVNTNSTLNNVASHMTINSSAEYLGGLVGFFGGETSTLTNSYSVGSVAGRKNFIGGLVGFFGGQEISSSFSKANVSITSPTPKSYVGGLVGYNNNTANFSNLNYQGDITASNGIADYVGGAFGYVKANSIGQVYTTGSINGVRNTVGGIAGYLRAPLNSAMSSMNLNASFKNVGGIAGIALYQNISNTFFTGTATGDGNVGGVVGWYLPSGTNISNSYSTGTLYKLPGATGENSSFGPIAGDASSQDVATSYYSSIVFDQGAGANISDFNTSGSAQTPTQLASQASYPGFNFSTNWSMANPGFTLPGEAEIYDKAVLSWMTSPNYGFQAEQVFSDDPINEPDSIVIPDVLVSDSLALEFGSEHIDEITSVVAPTNVTVGNLEISISKPINNNELISGRMLVYGECGIARNVIQISGAFDLKTICQENNRWVAVIDSTDKAPGNLLLSVSLKNSTLSSGSPIVSKNLVKSSSLCDSSTANTSTYGNSGTGNGTTSPYIICNRGQFANIAQNPSANFELGKDIDFSGEAFTPIAVDFTGVLDGKDYKLKNYTINKASSVGVGLFKSIYNGTVKNVELSNFNVTGYSQVGGLTGSWKGTGALLNVKANGSVNGIQYIGGLIGIGNTSSALSMSIVETAINVTGNDYTGGIIGSVNTNDGSFNASGLTLNNNITSNGATGYVGGLAGFMLEPNLTIINVTQTNNIISYGENVGGLFGSIVGGSLTNCGVSGNITILRDGTDGFIGGIVGKSTDNTSINNCNYSGTIHAGSDHVAGIIGYMKEGSITGANTSGQINVLDERYNVPRKYVAGIIGRNEEEFNVALDNITSSMNINAKASRVGGLIGYVYGFGSTLRNSFATGSVVGETQFVGGLGGFFMGDILEDSHATGSVTVNNPTPYSYIGGLLGYSNSLSASHKRLYATGDITVNGGTADYVGGLVGFFRAGSLEDSYATGNISGDATRNSIGGLVGIMRGDLVSSYSTGDVTCKGGSCGGLVGYLLNSNISYSFANGNVVSKNAAGGLVGYVNIQPENSIQNNYATGSVTRVASSTTELSKFGPIFGEELNLGSVSATGNYYINENSNPLHNLTGVGLLQSLATISSSYTNFNFADASLDWMMPPANFEIESGVAYNYPVPDWLGGGGGGTTLFTIGGTLSGLQYDNIRVTLNGSETLTLNPGDTSFTFATQVAQGNVYSVAITKNPAAPSISCNITNQSGTMVGNVTNVSVVCPEFVSIDLAASTTMPTGSSQALTVNGTLSNSSLVDVTAYSSFSQSPVDTFVISGSTLTSNVNATADVTADFMGLSSTKSITSTPSASSLNIIGAIANVTSNATLASIQVEILDQIGQRVTTATSPISLSILNNSTGATLSGSTTQNAVAGVVTFNDIQIDKAGTYTLVAQSSGLTNVNTNSFTVSPGAKASLAFVSQPQGANSGANFSAFAVEVLDAAGNRVQSTETVSLAIGNDPSSGSGTLSGTLSRQTTNGVATFNDISLDFATTGYTLVVSNTGLSSIESNSFNIFATATKLIVLVQPTNTAEGSNISSIQVALSDDFNNVITNSNATITLALNNDPTSSAVLSGTVSRAAYNGIASFGDLSIDRAGTGFNLIATSNSVSSVVTNGFNILITKPSALTLIDPAGSPSTDATPTIRVAGVDSGDVVNLYSNSSCNGDLLASMTSSGITADVTTNTLTPGTYTIYANRLNSQGTLSACSTNFISYELESTFGQSDNMSSFDNWTNVTGDNGDWIINTGDTPSAGVGPSTGTYAYTEASNAAALDEFVIQSNILDGANNSIKFDFKWNKRGSNMGDLIVEASNDGGSTWSSVWSHTGSDVATSGSDIWRNQSVDLCAMNYNSANVAVRIKAVMPASGSIFESDIAVDDLTFSDGGCTAAPASVAFTSPSAGSLINAANMSAFNISGSCSDNGQNVILSGAASQTVVCNSNSWNATLDLSVVADGTVNIIATHVSSTGGQNGTDSRSFVKDGIILQYDSFDTFGNWTNSTADQWDWAVITGATPSAGVGPDGGVNNSSYIYAEATGVNRNDNFIIESNILDGATYNLRVDFSWNKRGSNMGDLYLEASTDGGLTWNTTLWSHIGDDITSGGTSTWRSESVDICAAGVATADTKLRFRAQMPGSGNPKNSDIGLDEVTFRTDGCTSGTPASIAITSPASGTIIDVASQSAFTVGGTCSDHGQNITFSGDVSGSTTCNLGNWTQTFDVSALPDGNVTIIADHISSTGGATGRATGIFVKDTATVSIQLDDFTTFGNWTNVAYDDSDWLIISGNTPSGGVGPSSGFGGSGNYIYTEANGIKALDEFIVESNTFDLNTYALDISFNWNKRGDTMGDLHLEYSNDNGASWNNVWSHIGGDIGSNGVDIWRSESIDLCNAGVDSGNVKFRFRAVMPQGGRTRNSDIGLDHIEFTNSGCN